MLGADTHSVSLRRKHSINDTIFKFSTDLQLNRNNKKKTIALFIDFLKACDTVNHKILIEKLYALKKQGNVLSSITSYLTNRTQITNVMSGI